MLKKLASPAWAILEYGSYPLLLLVATPWFLRQLGTEQYGHWMLLTAVVNFGGVLNVGTGAATIKGISAGLGANVAGGPDRVVNASLAIAVLGGGILALAVLSVSWSGASTVLGRMGQEDLVRLTGAAAAVLIWLEQLDNVFASAIKGAEKFGQAARVEMASKAVQVAAAALVLYAFPLLTALYATLLVVSVLRLSAKIVVARRLLGLGGVRPSIRNASDILHFAKWGWLQGIGGVLFGVVDRMLIGSLLGATSLTYYSIASQLAMQVHAVSAAGLSVIFPKVSRLSQIGGRFSLRRLTAITFSGNLLLSTALALILIAFGPAFLRAWIGADPAGPISQLLPWLVLAYWILALNAVFYYLLLGMGRIRFVSTTVIASGTCAAIAVYFAISMAGLMGAPVGRAVYAILSLVLALPIVKALASERAGVVAVPAAPSSSDAGTLS